MVKQYIKFLLKSTNQHGVHSPFVYDLVTQCFYDSKNYPEYKQLKAYRKTLVANKQVLEISDLGAGSKVSANKTRAVSSLAKHSGSSFKRSKLLFRLTRYFQAKNILELGTSVGIATQALHLGNPDAMMTSIEGCPNISNTAKAHLGDIKNLQLLIGDFDRHIDQLEQDSFDLVFFDGNHSQEATLRYFEKLLPKAHNDTLFIFDDIYWSEGMTAAWETIKNHPEVKVTVDTFFWGLVFFRKEQVKEHFRIRL
ncbi:O-methyltransferase [Xanthomarina sp. F2636L]|uniref:O-methyltransferase n=1 Tax=Xanthomarina sp. F2636L TaxID=2996018 RepID=UPI00225DDC8C|nr:class I SAM-dependent methyltransferase [Xanthomarina sp. F2636L]MCX7549342.1 class I SAM-dependent methyltransferase [Xanthomarina sp. F2636L]